MRGIILAGDTGPRLRSRTGTRSTYVPLVYDKPMVYYPLSLLMASDIRELLLVSGPEDIEEYRQLLGDGNHLGLRIEHAAQTTPDDLLGALALGAGFIGDQPVCLVRGDNIFHGCGLSQLLRAEADRVDGCTLFSYPAREPGRGCIAETDERGRLTRLASGPADPAPDRVVVTGLHFYSPDVVQHARALRTGGHRRPGVIDLHNAYIADGRSRLVRLGRGTAWLQARTYDSLLAASNFVQTIQHRNGERVACLEEVAWRMGFIDTTELLRLAAGYGPESSVSGYLVGLLPSVGRTAVVGAS